VIHIVGNLIKKKHFFATKIPIMVSYLQLTFLNELQTELWLFVT